MNKLLRSDDISNYINNLSHLLLSVYIHTTHRLIFVPNVGNTTKVCELEFYVSISDVTKTLNIINSVKYNIDIEISPEFQYVKNMISKLEHLFTKLLLLDKKTKTLLIKAVETNNIEIAKAYHSFAYYVFDRKNYYKPSNYPNLDYNVLSHIIELYDVSTYAKYLSYYLRMSLNTFTLLHCNIFYLHTTITKKEVKKQVIELLKCLTSQLTKYWNNYIKATKITIFLQSLIQDLIKQNNHKSDNALMVLTLLIHSYEKNIINALSMVVDLSKNYLFLSSIY